MCGNCQRGFFRLKRIWRTSAFDRHSIGIRSPSRSPASELMPQLLREVYRDTAFVVLDELKSRNSGSHSF
jgi:hypothetical protein